MRKFLLFLPVGIVVVFVIFYSLNSNQISDSEREKISINELDFEVLQPDLSGSSYTLVDTWIIDDVLVFDYEGSQSSRMRISQGKVTEGDDLGITVNSLFRNYNPVEVSINDKKGYLLTKPEFQSETGDLSKLLTWDDEERHFNLFLTPADSMTDDALVQLVSDFYN